MPRPPYGKRVLETLQTAIRISNVKQETLERALGMCKGYLSQVFSGRIELKVWHLDVLLGEIGFEPWDFFELAYSGPDEEDAAARMKRFATYVGSHPAAARPVALPAGMRAAIVEAVREVLAEHDPAPEGEPDGGGPQPRRPARRQGWRARPVS